jgi:hypothetical protein
VVLTGDYRYPPLKSFGSEFQAERKFGFVCHDAWPTCLLASIIEFIIQLLRLRAPSSVMFTVKAARMFARYRFSRR